MERGTEGANRRLGRALVERASQRGGVTVVLLYHSMEWPECIPQLGNKSLNKRLLKNQHTLYLQIICKTARWCSLGCLLVVCVRVFQCNKGTLFLVFSVKMELRLRIRSVIEDKMYESCVLNIPRLSITNPGNTQNEGQT